MGFFMNLRFILILPFILCAPENYGEEPTSLEKKKDEITFNDHIKPIFEKHCLLCHKSRLFAQGGLRLNTTKSILKGGDSGPSVVMGEPENSLLMQLITLKKGEERRMPPEDRDPLNPDEILLIEKWIQQGVK